MVLQRQRGFATRPAPSETTTAGKTRMGYLILWADFQSACKLTTTGIRSLGIDLTGFGQALSSLSNYTLIIISLAQIITIYKMRPVRTN